MLILKEIFNFWRNFGVVALKRIDKNILVLSIISHKREVPMVGNLKGYLMRLALILHQRITSPAIHLGCDFSFSLTPFGKLGCFTIKLAVC